MSNRKIIITQIQSKKGNNFLKIEGGRSYGLPPWLTAEEAQGVLDNETTIRAFIAGCRVNRPLTVVPAPVVAAPSPVVPLVQPVQPAPEPEVQVAAPAPPAPPAPEQVSVPRPPAQTDITTNINPKVAALVARAMGGNKGRRFSSVA